MLNHLSVLVPVGMIGQGRYSNHGTPGAGHAKGLLTALVPDLGLIAG